MKAKGSKMVRSLQKMGILNRASGHSRMDSEFCMHILEMSLSLQSPISKCRSPLCIVSNERYTAETQVSSEEEAP